MPLNKRITSLRSKVDRDKSYPVQEGLQLVKETATAKFDESVDAVINLGIDAKKSDQLIRGALVLPNGTGKTTRVAVFAQGAAAEAAKGAGADIVGFDDLAEKIKGGMMDFDVVIATPDAMKVVGALGQVLGPRGLMPNPKVGTVTPSRVRPVSSRVWASTTRLYHRQVISSPSLTRATTSATVPCPPSISSRRLSIGGATGTSAVAAVARVEMRLRNTPA